MEKNIKKSSQESTNTSSKTKNNNTLSTRVENLQEALKDAIVLIQELSDKVCNLETKVEVLNTILDIRKDGPGYVRNAPLISRRLNEIDKKLCCATNGYKAALEESEKNEIRAKAAARFNYLMEHPFLTEHNGRYSHKEYERALEKANHELHWGY